MKCTGCQPENPPGSNFCSRCGARLGAVCSACGGDLALGSRFCNRCGAAVETTGARFASPGAYTPKHLAERILTSKAALEGERKQVTVLFADLKGSMELLAYLRPLTAHCHARLARLYQDSGKRPNAAEHAAKAGELYREMGMTFWLARFERAPI